MKLTGSKTKSVYRRYATVSEVDLAEAVRSPRRAVLGPDFTRDTAHRLVLIAQFVGATLAQLVEHVTENHGVPSSILGGRTIFFSR